MSDPVPIKAAPDVATVSPFTRDILERLDDMRQAIIEGNVDAFALLCLDKDGSLHTVYDTEAREDTNKLWELVGCLEQVKMRMLLRGTEVMQHIVKSLANE